MLPKLFEVSLRFFNKDILNVVFIGLLFMLTICNLIRSQIVFHYNDFDKVCQL
jgi:5-bromo-4-chloroindolyl phosphate hydrolysis protein